MGKPKKKKEVVFDVESIVAKRIVGEEVEYYVKWVGYDSADNTWEPVSHLSCPDLIDEYERTHEGQHVERVPMTIEPANGFDHKWVPIKVFGATKRETDQRLMVMIKWRGNRTSFEFADVANQIIPELVIAYYEQRIRWKKADNGDEDERDGHEVCADGSRKSFSQTSMHNTIDGMNGIDSTITTEI